MLSRGQMYLAYSGLFIVLGGLGILLISIGIPRSGAMITCVILALVLGRMLQRLDRNPHSF